MAGIDSPNACSRLPLALLIVTLGAACDSADAPRTTALEPAPVPAPSSPAWVRHTLTGRVTDESGSPIAGATIELDYPSGGPFSSPSAFCTRFGFCWIATRSDGDGRYAITFEPGQGLIFGAAGAGLFYAYHDDYELNAQLLSHGTTDIVQNMRLRRIRPIEAGHSTTVSIEADSSLCTDLEDWWQLTTRCEIVTLIAPDGGSLTVEAVSRDGGAITPTVFFATTGEYTHGQALRPGAASVGVKAGQRYRVFVGVPVGITARLEVVTSLR